LAYFGMENVGIRDFCCRIDTSKYHLGLRFSFFLGD
jgi:hypothetical protein